MMKLELSWFPLARFLEDKFKWAEMIASTRQIRLSIQDNTVSTTTGMQKLLELTSRDASSSDLVVRDIEGGFTIVTSCLYTELLIITIGHLFSDGLDISLHPVQENRREPLLELPPFAKSVLHVDMFKIEQLLRNVVTKAVRVPLTANVTVIWHFHIIV